MGECTSSCLAKDVQLELQDQLLKLAEKGEAAACDELITHHSLEVNFQEHQEGNTALHLAAEEGHDSVIRVLLAAKANPNARNTYSLRAIDLADSSSVAFSLLNDAWQILEAHGKADAQSHQILQRRMGLFCWQLLERHQLSRLTSSVVPMQCDLCPSCCTSCSPGSLLKEHCHLPLQAPWQLLGKGKVRKQLWSSAVLDQEEDAQWCGYAWIQFKVFVPVPQHLVDRTGLGGEAFDPTIQRAAAICSANWEVAVMLEPQ
eukprot:g16277.t1